MVLAISACSADGPSAASDVGNDTIHEDPQPSYTEPFVAQPGFLHASTVSQRVGLPLAGQGAILRAGELARQLSGYDPGSLLRCQLAEQAAYDAAVDALGGVRWGYSVSKLEDQSQPRFLAGFQNYDTRAAPSAAGTAADSSAPAVEIVLPDIVAVTESAALFYSPSHGLLLVNIAAGEPTFKCATPLPGRVDQFFYRNGHLVAMTQANGADRSTLLHFQVAGIELRFVESVDLGQVEILDSRRFNDKLVFYTDLRLNATTPPVPVQPNPSQGAFPIGADLAAPSPPVPQVMHRALRVFRLGETLQEELYDTLIDTTQSEERLLNEAVTSQTPIDTLVNESHRFGQAMWASDHYFVVTEELSKTFVSSWRSHTYSTCTASHTVETPYNHCWTEYETRPNPSYTPPDNSGGDRSCQSATLSDCLVAVARVSNQTIQVPVGRRCEERIRQDWVCDAREQRTAQYPEFRSEQSTRLFIYEYNDSGFVRVDGSVHEITTPGLAAESPDAQVSTLTTSTETFDLAVPGSIQTLYFQNGHLYVISEGVLQVYALGGSSIVRTSTLPVVNDSLESSLFSSNRLYLSDFGWRNGDHSTLRVVNLNNPAFPTVQASTQSLPGGHRSILASDYGIFTIGSVQQFEGRSVSAIKLGLFSDPFVTERAYLILATDLSGARLAAEESQLFDAGEQRALVPYSGRDEQQRSIARVGVSHLEADQIVSEGAVVVPEVPERVRRLAGTGEGYLSFATNSIEWLRLQEQEWQATPVLEYFQPGAVYRISDQDDYVELQRLGNRCKLFFANASNINERDTGEYSEELECIGWGATAYANRLIWGDGGVEFDASAHSARALSAEEVVETRTRISERPVCLLSLDLVQDTRVNYDAVPGSSAVTCMSAQQYQQRQNELLNQRLRP
ncbi:MAG: hypothetical protein ABI895_16195 [Deltaproteobacteria bacterium]